MVIIIPHQLSLAPPPVPPPVFSGPLPNPQRSAFLFPAIFSLVPFGLLSCFLWSAFLFPSFRLFVPFGPFSCSLCSASSFLSVRYSLSFVPRSCSLRPASPFPLACSFVSFVSLACSFWSGSTRHYFVVSSFPSSFSLPLCQVFSPLSNPTHALQRSRRRPSTFETTPFLLQEHALQRSRRRPSPLVSVCV